jgi:hypothetical protein
MSCCMRRKWHGIWPAKPRRSEEREETCRPPRNPSSPHRHCEPQLASPSLRTPTRLTVIANPNWGEATQAHAAHRKIRAHSDSRIMASRPRAPSSSRAASRPIVIASRLAPHRHREPPRAPSSSRAASSAAWRSRALHPIPLAAITDLPPKALVYSATLHYLTITRSEVMHGQHPARRSPRPPERPH